MLTFPILTERLELTPLTQADRDAFVAYRRIPAVARWQSWNPDRRRRRGQPHLRPTRLHRVHIRAVTADRRSAPALDARTGRAPDREPTGSRRRGGSPRRLRPVFSAAFGAHLVRQLRALQGQVDADIRGDTDAEAMAGLAFGAYLGELLRHGQPRNGWADGVVGVLLQGTEPTPS